jgi:hypothetical protein
MTRATLIDRIRKLLALGQGDTPEAKSARKMAASLRYRHDVSDEEIDDSDLRMGQTICRGRRFDTSWRILLWRNLALPLGCSITRRKKPEDTFVTVKGTMGRVRETCSAYWHVETEIDKAILTYLRQASSFVRVSRSDQEDFSRGVVEAVSARWKAQVLDRSRAEGSEPPKPALAMTSDDPSALAGETIVIAPVNDRRPLRLGMEAGQKITMPTLKKHDRKIKVPIAFLCKLHKP